MSARTIIVNDLGPAGNFVVPVQPGGTIIEGYCGVGKSITLEAIALGLGSKERGRVAPRDGTKRGSIDCLGVILNVSASRVTRNGESEVASIEEFDIGTLIDPPVKDDEARNRHGIKSLLRMTKAEADPALFYHLAGGKDGFSKIIAPDAVKSADLVEMAGKVKRAFDAAKRRFIEQAETEEGAALAYRNAGDGLNLTIEIDSKKLQAIHSEAVAAYSRLETQFNAANDAKADADEARQKLAAATGGNRTVAEFQAAEKEKADAYAQARDRVKALEDDLRVAKAEAMAAWDSYTSAQNQTTAAKQTEAATAGWQAAIDQAASVIGPSVEEVRAAKEAVKIAQQAIETAAVVRAAKDRIAKAKAHQEKAAEYRKEAQRLMEAGLDTDAVLSDAVASERFGVRNGVLTGMLPSGIVKPYYDMSDGERTLIATAEKIDRVRMIEPDESKLAIIDLPQRTFQDIPESVRRMLFAKAAVRNVCIVTAQVTDCKELSAMVVEVSPGDLEAARNGELVTAA